MGELIKSVYENQTDILKGIQTLYCPDGFSCDITYGKGNFWKGLTPPEKKFDIDPQTPDTIRASSTDLPLEDGSLPNIVFDPPFLTYVKQGRTHSGGKFIMSKQFSGYWRYDELIDHYKKTLKETSRVLAKKGILVFKCQDIIHNHRMRCTHYNVIEWAREENLRLKDLFILVANHRLPTRSFVTGHNTQQHARVYHSYFLVFEKHITRKVN